MAWVEWVNWIVTLGVGGVIAWWLWRRLRWEYAGVGEPVCPTCGYVVIGLTGVVCPECGNDLERSGIVRVGRKRGRGWIPALVVWTLMMFVGWAFADNSLSRAIFLSRESNETEVMGVDMGAGRRGVLEIRAGGIAFGSEPGLQKMQWMWMRLEGGMEKLVWQDGKASGEAELVAWLESQGMTRWRAEIVGKELAKVVESSGRLPTLADFDARRAWDWVDGKQVPAMWVSGVRVQELEMRGSRGVNRVRPVLTSEPWVLVGVGLMWLVGVRALWPGRRRVEEYVRAEEAMRAC